MPTTRSITVPLYPRVLFALLLLCLCTKLPQAAHAAQVRTENLEQDQATTLSGTVVDASGKPVGGAQVSAQAADGSKSVQITADASGAFLFSALRPGGYTLHADKQGSGSERSSLVVAKGSQGSVRLVLHEAATAAAGAASSAETAGSMEFVDKPAFTVAGVTDWTAVGGHGSDATLRTSEELNRQTLALRAGVHPAARLRGDKADDEYNLALTLKDSGNFRAAQLHVKRALALSDAGDFHRLAGELEEKLGNPLAAVHEEQRATQLDPSEENYFTWGSELLLHRAIWQAADVFATAAKAFPASVRVKTAWGAALFAGARYDEAAEKICEASDQDPAAREPYLFAGRIALAAPSTAGCVAQKLERFLAMRPDDPEANYLYAMFLLRPGAASEPGRAQQLLLKAVALDPKCSDAYLQLGILSASRKDYTGAIAYYRQALEADPQKGEAHYRLGVAYDRTGESAKAQKEYQLHERMDAADAALVEQQRREVKQFSIVTEASPAPAASR